MPRESQRLFQRLLQECETALEPERSTVMAELFAEGEPHFAFDALLENLNDADFEPSDEVRADLTRLAQMLGAENHPIGKQYYV
jgi:hypothetical protein